jgi:hypothetical protein
MRKLTVAAALALATLGLATPAGAVTHASYPRGHALSCHVGYRGLVRHHWVTVGGRRILRGYVDCIWHPVVSSLSAPVATPGLASTNWSGYVLTGEYQAVSGEWTVPTLNCAVVPGGVTVDWVGVNGWDGSANLFQTGSESACVNGVQANDAWWTDAALGYVAQDQLAVNAGDVISAEVQQSSSGTWTATVTDVTSGQSATASDSAVYAGSSAEWVTEDPTVQGSSDLTPLADFGIVTFTNLQVVPTSALTYADAIEMQTSGGTVEAMPSQPQGASFSAAYEPTT